MSNIEVEQIAKIIVDSLENTTLTSEQKVEVICAILKSSSKFSIPEKKHKLNDLFNLFKEMEIPIKEIPMFKTENEEIDLKNYVGIFYEDNSFTIAQTSYKSFIMGVHKGQFDKYFWSLTDIDTGIRLDSIDSSSYFAEPSWYSDERGNSTLKNGQKIYFIKLSSLLCFTNISKKEVKPYSYRTIDLKYLKQIIDMTNKYLDENPLFTEQLFFKNQGGGQKLRQ